jgi:hypothetical protein
MDQAKLLRQLQAADADLTCDSASCGNSLTLVEVVSCSPSTPLPPFTSRVHTHAHVAAGVLLVAGSQRKISSKFGIS